ncbi:hypothetical protein [Streptomyces sp. NPDC093097]|uniref:hypothetical protein n=1 Tax=Streptomyces sp. NPDC093097 TaxID=3366027 RepID=UPI003827E07A
MTGRAAAHGTARCPPCRAPVLRQLVGDTAALTVTADLRPLTPAEQTTVRAPNRLIWCLVQRPHTSPRLRWIDAHHPARCPYQHVTEHACPGPGSARPAAPEQHATLF